MFLLFAPHLLSAVSNMNSQKPLEQAGISQLDLNFQFFYIAVYFPSLVGLSYPGIRLQGANIYSTLQNSQTYHIPKSAYTCWPSCLTLATNWKNFYSISPKTHLQQRSHFFLLTWQLENSMRFRFTNWRTQAAYAKNSGSKMPARTNPGTQQQSDFPDLQREPWPGSTCYLF